MLATAFTLYFESIRQGEDVFYGPGSRGLDVALMQNRLKNLGFLDGAVNGVFDARTFFAVLNYQKSRKLRAVGFADSVTVDKIFEEEMPVSGEAYAETAANTSDETQLMARAINGEARGEPYIGQVAVGAVILNRTKHPSYPNTIAGVIYQPGAFTAVSDGQINLPISKDSQAYKAARDAMNGWDPTGGAIYYFNPATATNKWVWSRPLLTTIGKHRFCK